MSRMSEHALEQEAQRGLPDPQAYSELLEFVEQMARMTTGNDPDEIAKRKAKYAREYNRDPDDVEDWEVEGTSDMGDDELCDEVSAFWDMIQAARELVEKVMAPIQPEEAAS